MTPLRDVAIVGAGLLGLAAGRAIAARGRDVVVLEQASIGHDRGGSKGSCRIFRLGYPDSGYVAAARLARELWLQLESETGRQILFPAPHLTFGPGLADVQEALRAAGAPCELMTAAAAAERFPQIRTGGPTLLEPDSAVTAADQALAALATGVPDIRTGVRVLGLADDGRQVTLRTTAGPITARVAVVTAGPWSTHLLAGAGVTVPGRPTLEQAAYLQPAAASRAEHGDGHAGAHADGHASAHADGHTSAHADAHAAQPMPIFIVHDDASPYGLPVPGSQLYKIGIHGSGPAVDPDAQDQVADPAMLARLSETADQLLPGYDPRPVNAERCIYDNSPDEDFVLDRIGNVVIGSGTSGHGFKFGPMFGEWLATLATGLSGPAPDPRFALARFAGH